MTDDQIDVSGGGPASEAWRRGLASAVALFAALLLIALVILVARSNEERDIALERERHSYDILVITRTLDASMARSEAALGRFVISGEPGTGTLYSDEWRRAGRQIRQLQEMTPTALPARPNMARMVSTSASLCSAQSEQRSRVMLAGVAGGRARFT